VLKGVSPEEKKRREDFYKGITTPFLSLGFNMEVSNKITLNFEVKVSERGMQASTIEDVQYSAVYLDFLPGISTKLGKYFRFGVSAYISRNLRNQSRTPSGIWFIIQRPWDSGIELCA